MGCGDACPWISAGHREDRELADAKDVAADDCRAVRVDIERRVQAPLESVRAEHGSPPGERVGDISPEVSS